MLFSNKNKMRVIAFKADSGFCSCWLIKAISFCFYSSDCADSISFYFLPTRLLWWLIFNVPFFKKFSIWCSESIMPINSSYNNGTLISLKRDISSTLYLLSFLVSATSTGCLSASHAYQSLSGATSNTGEAMAAESFGHTLLFVPF